MLTISALIVLLCLIGSTAGFPLDNSSIDLKIERTDVNKIFRRQCIWSEAKDDWVCDYWLPSLSQIIDRMRDDASGGLADVDHSIVFYTGLNIPQDEMCSVIEHWASAQKLTYYWYETCQSWAWLERQERWVDTKDFADRVTPHGLFGDWPIDTWMSCQFQALALAAISPDVYLLMNAGERWADESSWEEYEYWALTHNPYVKRIWRADPDLLLAKPYKLWEKGNAATENGGKPLPPKFYCTVKYITDPIL